MTLIDVFTDYIVNKKSLVDYVEVRKTMNERGEFNDQKLIRIQEHLERLKTEEPEIYKGMYAVLAEIMRRDEGYYVEYPINFARAILKMYENGVTAKKVYEEYKQTLHHQVNNA